MHTSTKSTTNPTNIIITHMASLENAKFRKKPENATGICRPHGLYPIRNGVKYNHTYIIHIYNYKIIVEC